ncbi:type III secretion system chaperone [Brevifollis gellanilyticus]|uniref:Type III secretion system chaperone n=1 Tax=Brevifollis gellanilyticus TaxID=748831 RepID=A0A512MD75_9BACT|nr:type III secretion system chaperone [Brevifollis gellanilyticus]GEP44652.1 hypothetical protein BGE01nite_39430 [Brevifollis gellanilyticus]
MTTNNLQALEALSVTLGLPLAFNQDNTCDLVIDEAEVALRGDPASHVLKLSAVIGTLENNESPAGLKMLLKANFQGQGVGGACLSMDHLSEDVVLCQSVDVSHLGPEGVAPVLEKFVNYLEFWQANLARLTADDTDPDSGSGSGDAAGLIRI